MAWRNTRSSESNINTSVFSGVPQYPRIRQMIRDMINASQYDYHESESFLVKEVILNDPINHGAVRGTFINSPQQEPTDGVVYPLMPNIIHIPLIGEHVVVTEYNGQHYYTSVINRKNSPNENSIVFDLPANTKFGKTFKRKDIKHIEVCEGEIVFEGRFGNSIKLGCNHKNNSPNIKIRAGQRTDYDGTTAVVPESINEDKSSIYLSTGEKGDNPITIAKPTEKTVSGNSIVMNSDKLFFNSKDGDIHIRASKDMILESSKGSIVLNAKSGQTIKMGDPRAPMIPTVNGQKLLELFTGLMKLLTAVPKLATPATMAQAGKDIAIELPKVTQQVVNKEFLNMQVMTADPAFKVPEPPKIPKLPDLKLKKLKLEQGIKLPKKLSVSDLTDKI